MKTNHLILGSRQNNVWNEARNHFTKDRTTFISATPFLLHICRPSCIRINYPKFFFFSLLAIAHQRGAAIPLLLPLFALTSILQHQTELWCKIHSGLSVFCPCLIHVRFLRERYERRKYLFCFWVVILLLSKVKRNTVLQFRWGWIEKKETKLKHERFVVTRSWMLKATSLCSNLMCSHVKSHLFSIYYNHNPALGVRRGTSWTYHRVTLC